MTDNVAVEERKILASGVKTWSKKVNSLVLEMIAMYKDAKKAVDPAIAGDEDAK